MPPTEVYIQQGGSHIEIELSDDEFEKMLERGAEVTPTKYGLRLDMSASPQFKS